MAKFEDVHPSKFEDKTANLYEACNVLSKRARTINHKNTEELNLQLGELDNDEENPEDTANREAIVKEFDKRPKPIKQAMAELRDGDIEFEYKEKKA